MSEQYGESPIEPLIKLQLELQQTREELEVERKTNNKYIEMYEVLCGELEQVKAERDEARKDAFNSRERLARYRTELSAMKLIAQKALNGSLDDAHEALTKIAEVTP